MTVMIDAPASPLVASAPPKSKKGMWGSDRNYAQSFACDPALKAALEAQATARGITKSKLLYQAIKAIEEFGVWDALLNPERVE